jgi:hypothetical protein
VSVLKEYTFRVGRYGPGMATVVVEAHSRFEAEARASAQVSRMGIAHPELELLGYEEVEEADERSQTEWDRKWDEWDRRTNPSGGDGEDD